MYYCLLWQLRSLWTPGHHWFLTQEDWSITSWGSLAPHHGVLRWRVPPQCHSQFPHRTRISRANLSPSLSNSTMIHVLHSITCPILSSPSMASTTYCQLNLQHPGEETILRVGSQTGACRNLWATSGRWGLSAGHFTPLKMLLSLVAGPVPPTEPTTWE